MNSTPRLIGINGEIGCGKTTITNYLCKKLGAVEYMFAEPLKQIGKILGFEHSQVFGTQEEKLEINKFWNISGRHFLQVFGSEVCRDYVPQVLPNMNFNGSTMWVRLFEKFYGDKLDTKVIVSDVRFEDESKKIKELGGLIIRIIRPKAEIVDEPTAEQSLPDQDKLTEHLVHKSEMQADKIKPHITIYNDGTIEELYKKLDAAIYGYEMYSY
jgi:hypothetical protein